MAGSGLMNYEDRLDTPCSEAALYRQIRWSKTNLTVCINMYIRTEVYPRIERPLSSTVFCKSGLPECRWTVQYTICYRPVPVECEKRHVYA
jgi:hypothetical protein